MSQINLLIPQLLSPLQLWNKDFAFKPSSAVLSELFASSSKNKTHTHGLNASLFSLLGLDKKAELPVAHYRYQLDFGREPDSHIICVDPVNLQAGMDEIILSAIPIDDLSKMDAEELIEGLNKHFAQDDWEFVVADSGNWYLKHQSNEAIHTTPLDYARGKSIFKYLPQSKTLNWLSLQNEIQMLLHMEQLNQTREVASQLPVNSLWFWGAGKPVKLSHTFDAIWSHSDDSKVAAHVAGITHNELSESHDALLNGNHIIVLDSLYYPAIQDQYSHWQQTLEQLETEFIAPLAKTCKQKNIELTINTCDGKAFSIKQKPSWKFWKKSTANLLEF